ncbi:MAG: polysaccharide deacetylase family protein [Patescibacteria group bacterium]|nr:polysaccharide deacetylase family protein [Patescibacteria group bacterium]
MLTKKRKGISRVNGRHILFSMTSTLAAVVFILLLFFPVVSAQIIHPLAETENNEVHVLPQDIKDVLGTSLPAVNYRIPILMYHYVEYVQDKKDTVRQSLDITPNILDQQLLTLKNAGYTFMTARQLGDVLDRRLPLPPKPVVLTFDDGYRDFYTDAYPVLKKYHIHATAYIVPGFLDTPNYMFSYQIRNLINDGLVEIGAHTIHHVWLKDMPYNEASKEILMSKKMLESEFSIGVVSFAYPYGAFDKQALALVRKAGFWTSVSTVPGIDANVNDRYFLYRLRPGGRVGNDLLNWLAQTSY